MLRPSWFQGSPSLLPWYQTETIHSECSPFPRKLPIPFFDSTIALVLSIPRLAQCMKVYNTVDGRNPAPPKKPWKNDFYVNTSTMVSTMVSKWCGMDFRFSIHSICPESFSESNSPTLIS